jgi:hypothetical protein
VAGSVLPDYPAMEKLGNREFGSSLCLREIWCRERRYRVSHSKSPFSRLRGRIRGRHATRNGNQVDVGHPRSSHACKASFRTRRIRKVLRPCTRDNTQLIVARMEMRRSDDARRQRRHYQDRRAKRPGHSEPAVRIEISRLPSHCGLLKRNIWVPIGRGLRA